MSDRSKKRKRMDWASRKPARKETEEEMRARLRARALAMLSGSKP